mgnify:FL=1
MIKRIIFDIDGTLITDVDFSSYVANALKKYGIEDIEKTKQFLLNIKEYEKTYNSYDRNLYLKFFCDKLGCELDNHFLEIFFQELRKAIPENTEKIKSMLAAMNEYELVLLSNYFEESQRNRLTAMGINDYFSEYYGESIIKPNELAYRQAQGIYQPSECVIVGDDKRLDIDVPKSLGFKTIYVNENGDIKRVEELSPRLIKKL